MNEKLKLGVGQASKVTDSKLTKEIIGEDVKVHSKLTIKTQKLHQFYYFCL